LNLKELYKKLTIFEKAKAMKWVVAGISLGTGAVIGVPAVLSTFSPAFKYDEKQRWRPLGLLHKF
jgi:hypothetical protein